MLLKEEREERAETGWGEGGVEERKKEEQKG